MSALLTEYLMHLTTQSVTSTTQLHPFDNLLFKIVAEIALLKLPAQRLSATPSNMRADIQDRKASAPRAALPRRHRK